MWTKERIRQACKRAGVPVEAETMFQTYLTTVLDAAEEIAAEQVTDGTGQEETAE